MGLVASAGILLLGPHVQPTDEQTFAMADAYAKMYRHYGYKQSLPPWLPPIVATVLWIAPHIEDERSQAALRKWKARFSKMTGGAVNEKEPAPAEPTRPAATRTHANGAAHVSA